MWLHVSSTTQRYSVYRRRGLKKPENIHIWEGEMREFAHFFLKKWLINDESIVKIVGDYSNGWQLTD